MWQQTSNPGSEGGQAQGFFVTDGPLSGFAKPSAKSADGVCRAANEKIASDLAYELRLPVPPVTLWQRTISDPNMEVALAVSLVPFRPAHKWEIIERTPDALQRIVPMLSSRASAMVAFDTWIGNTDRINGGNLLVCEEQNGATSRVSAAYIDYSYSLTYQWAGGGHHNIAPVGPYPSQCQVDRSVLSSSVTAIEQMPDEAVRLIVSRMPDEFIEQAKKELTIIGLLHRRSAIRGVLAGTYGAMP